MKKMLFALVIFTSFACGPPSDHRTKNQKTASYPIEGNFREPIAPVVIDRNGRFDVAARTGSAFLLNKEQGIFGTAKHVVGEIDTKHNAGEFEAKYKLFFCGHVYIAERVLDTGVTDISFLRITSKFNPNDFPEPYRIAESMGVGEDVFVRGIHMHPTELQKDKVVHRIVRDYYGITAPKEKEREFVYDNLPAIIVDKEVLRRGDSVKNDDQNSPNALVQKDYGLKTKQDHKISFGGLSGGPTVNLKNEVVGINVVESGNEGDYVLDEKGINYRPRVTLQLLPGDELKRAMARLGITAK